MGSPVADIREVPGGLFLLEHWIKISSDLLAVAMDAYPGNLWTEKVKPQTRQWALEYLDYRKKEERIAKERALAKLTYDDKLALGLPV